jgi:hypothetical protein
MWLCKPGFLTKPHSAEHSKPLSEHLRGSGAEKFIIFGLHPRIRAPNALSKLSLVARIEHSPPEQLGSRPAGWSIGPSDA